MFTDMVNMTDEALVLQVVRYYFPRWDKGEEIGDEDESGVSKDTSSKQSGGAAKGETLTCSKTAEKFYNYVNMVRETRGSTFKVMWDERLRGEAVKRHSEEMDEERQRMEENIDQENEVNNVATAFYNDIMNGCWGGSFGVEELPSEGMGV